MDGKDSVIGRFLQNADSFTAEQVGQTAQLLLEHGVKWQASDIHIEPHEDYVLVRYRVDGSLHGAHKMPRAAHEALASHLKSKASLSTSQPSTPQQGRFSTTINDQEFNIAIATLPVVGGEKVVLHITTKVRTPLPLDQLGFWGQPLQTIQIALGRSHGLTIVSAPRHHGRPTTTASMLNALQNPSLSIMTIEDEIEYRIPHASQTVVNQRAGLSILQGLQAALYQDPNVLLVGNVPDRATADLTIRTALSGHLVVAGMHSGSACAALLHLRALGVAPYMVATGVKTVVAQRLVRKLCDNCSERYELSARQFEVLARVFGINSRGALARVHKLETQAAAAHMGSSKLSSSSSHISYLWRPHRDGCIECDHTGYKGRICLGEVLPVSERIQKAVHDPDQTVSNLQIIALADPDFVPLALDGLVKALRGLVTIKDVLRVVDQPV